MCEIIRNIINAKISLNEKNRRLDSIRDDIKIAEMILSGEFKYCPECDDYYLAELVSTGSRINQTFYRKEIIMKVKNLTLIFENCDYITIDGKYVGDFLVDNLHTCIRRIACNSIDKIDYADTIAIEIHKNANKDRYQFDQTDYPNWKQKTFDRITKYNDITSIEFELEESYVEEEETPKIECYQYYVDWVGDSEYKNDVQTSYISSDGNMYLVIAKNKSVKDFFDMESINNAEEMDFHFDMCDVGDEYGNPDRYK